MTHRRSRREALVQTLRALGQPCIRANTTATTPLWQRLRSIMKDTFRANVATVHQFKKPTKTYKP